MDASSSLFGNWYGLVIPMLFMRPQAVKKARTWSHSNIARSAGTSTLPSPPGSSTRHTDLPKRLPNP
eukprot:CAMPEP_0204436770 /NCGR_PEP_ID=MMETSP0470-20130426/76163_1 /ASSEMBLY_ACC=CAM_ASM_000385 /TAXON_ID=2969 /ORGANISM="Oxyrrhis marina" /LENGTH=66 /DNA_ID=CAMNT_0051435451 /DNA_START=216 /DNA_END=413 /DNA_ORIENTATION=-